MRTRSTMLAVLILSVSLIAPSAPGRADVHALGIWPLDWPEALEPFRERSVTHDVTAGARYKRYDIPVYSAEELAEVWPAVLTVQTPGSPLRVDDLAENPFGFEFGEGTVAVICIRAPSDAWIVDMTVRNADGTIGTRRSASYGTGAAAWRDTAADWRERARNRELPAAVRESDRRLFSGAPWPEHLREEDGGLPEYVGYDADAETLRWEPREPDPRGGFIYRARVDVMLFADDARVDVQSLLMPEDLEDK